MGGWVTSLSLFVCGRRKKKEEEKVWSEARSSFGLCVCVSEEVGSGYTAVCWVFYVGYSSEAHILSLIHFDLVSLSSCSCLWRRDATSDGPTSIFYMWRVYLKE